MTNLFELEKAAHRLRHCLKNIPRNDLRLLCGLQFFASLEPQSTVTESYLREFVPTLAQAADKTNPTELLPGEYEQLDHLLALIMAYDSNIINAKDISSFRKLATKMKFNSNQGLVPGQIRKHAVAVACLFVEHYPDIGLEPRGRALKLLVNAYAASPKAEADDIVVRNPTNEPDDRFLMQARDSLKAARFYLNKKYGLSMKKRYRVDFAVDSTGARFTGDSLGAAFAVGAIAAIAQIEVLRDRLSVAVQAAFTGALSAEGKLTPIDSQALKLKIHRAFHSGIKYLVIPREHITEAWAFLEELEHQIPGRRLELVGTETLASIPEDPRLIIKHHYPLPAHRLRQAWHSRRSWPVQLAALLVLISVLFLILFPISRKKEWNPAYFRVDLGNNRVEVLDRHKNLLFPITRDCILSERLDQDQLGYRCKAADINDDDTNEVLFMPMTDNTCADRDWIFFYSNRGDLLFKRYCAIPGEFLDDLPGTVYEALYVNALNCGKGMLIITEESQQLPMRSHIRIWDSRGDSIGWFINQGGTTFKAAYDVTGDGIRELFFLNIFNPMNAVSLLVIDPYHASGVGPPYNMPEDQELTEFLAHAKRGTHLAYVVFPPSLMCIKDTIMAYNIPGEFVRMQPDGSIDVFTSESSGTDLRDVIYRLNQEFRIESVAFTDEFEKRWKELIDEGTIPPINLKAYADSLELAVTYWTDSGWVTERQLRESLTGPQ